MQRESHCNCDDPPFALRRLDVELRAVEAPELTYWPGVACTVTALFFAVSLSSL
jgi:hypothetical protein